MESKSFDFDKIATLVSILRRFVKIMDRPGQFSTRKEDRITKTLPVKFKDGQTFVSAYTGNISTGGLFIKTENLLSVGQQFLLKLQIPDVPEPLQSNCQLIWLRKQREETKGRPAGMGAKFLEMPAKDTQILKQYLKEIMKI